eukprot:CAMPEP_0179280912 /NCGR_PEP_ID=MMETSP0797-20121207/36874_1 /TAXON_ID=47934 /ORGANISM="Dinophysis acuminata, Strain DAEP01" /LENGTH=179 /DNA_ID=CAMNT_0020989587 /DNA_START=97 /DNA_END=632 /DNA_ORIENTATION=+
MRRLFGTPKEQPAAAGKPGQNGLEDASQKIEARVQTIEDKIIKMDAEIRQLVAKGSNNPTTKQQALQAMKRKKMYEQQRDQLLATQFNVETMAFQQEQAEITAMTVQAMQAGQADLKKQAEKIDISKVDQLTDDMAELADEMKLVSDALAQNPANADDDDVAEEYAKMEEEMAAMTLAG